MKKSTILSVMLLLTTMALAQSTQGYFPRKNLIEHFTGDGCGYCPSGMYSLVNYITNRDSSAIWVSHHFGYNMDEYSIAENTLVGNSLNVSGAPSIAFNRTLQTGKTLAFHPGSLRDLDYLGDTVAEASVVITHTYDSITRTLDVTVSGQVANADRQAYLLSVLVKENRLVGKQADYIYSWKQGTWKEYMHARVVRDFLSAALGDTVKVENNAYSKSYTFNLSDKWVAENCCVVAYITPVEKNPVINAEQAAVVAGTTGGEEYLPYGITESQSPNRKVNFQTLQQSKTEDNVLELILISNTTLNSSTYGSLKPIMVVYVNTEADSLQAGTYPIQADKALGTVTAGYRIDEAQAMGGSVFAYVLTSDYNKGYLSVAHMWRMDSGEMLVDEQGNITITTTTYSNKNIVGNYIAPITGVNDVLTEDNTPTKILRNGQLIIIKDGVEYDAMGRLIEQ